MKKALILGFVSLIILSVCISAQAKNWGIDFEKALSEAKASGKYLLLDFSGSDWCGWCIKLEKEVFSQKKFKKYADKNLVCVLIDFPRAKSQSNKIKKQNQALAKKYSIRGYPTVVILSPNGALVGRTGYRQGGATAYVSHLKKIINKHKGR